jgi:hypothetical protein
MSAEDELTQAVSKAFDAYVATRAELGDALGSIGQDNLYALLTLAEEFGAYHARERILGKPADFGIEPDKTSSKGWSDDLELKLQRYLDANYDLDGVVAEQEQRRIEEGRSPDSRTIAFHGEFPVVDLVNQTITFPGRGPEVLVMSQGMGPEPLEPEPAPVRERSRGRGR